jgi:Tfp pilus assembly protein FimT
MTLVELLVVLGIIGVIVGMSVPGMVGYAQRVRLKAAVRQTMGLLSLARSSAITSHEEHAVIVDSEEGTLSVMNLSSEEALEQAVHLPSKVAVALQIGGAPSSEDRIVFRPTGALRGRTVSLILSDRDREQTITIMGTTGAIGLQ